MLVPSAALAAQTGPFVAAAAATGWRPPLRVEEIDARAWSLLSRGQDHLILDGYGDLWWARVEGSDARIVRPPWPEELASLRGDIARALTELRARACHPAGRGRVDGDGARA